MAFESLQPLQLSESEKRTEQDLENFEIRYPGMLLHVVSVNDVLAEMRKGEEVEV